MALFEWKDSFSVGIGSIDEDHKGLINIINELFDAVSHGVAKEHISSDLAKLVDYTKTHFKREEIFFEKTNYPLLEEHKLQHDVFIKKINNLFRAGLTLVLSEYFSVSVFIRSCRFLGFNVVICI